MKKLGILLLVLIFTQGVLAAHWISGWTNDALDGEPSDGKSIVMWNPSVGLGDNLTDIVGVSGASGVSGVYMMDCEMLSGGCLVGDILKLKIFGERYVSWIGNVTVSGFGYDVPENLSLNSPPSVELVYPVDSGYSDSEVEFNCSFFDYDDNVKSVSLWGNWSGNFIEVDNITSGFGSGYVVFNETLSQGNYLWNCYVEDELGIGSFDLTNNSFFVDTTAPLAWGVSSVSDVCGFGEIPVECSASDNIGIGSVMIQSDSPSGVLINHSAIYVSNNVYRANISLNEVGDWGFGCFANDSVGNLNYSSGDFVKASSGLPELGFIGGVNIDKNPSVEGEIINLSVNVSNSGCVGSGNFVVGFMDDGISFANVSVSVGANGFLKTIASWTADIGLSEFVVYADVENKITEDNESNNIVNGSAWMESWQKVYGNVSLVRVLAGGDNKLGNWSGGLGFVGSVFIADSEANVDWNSLQAIGQNKIGGVSSGDFGEIDSRLGMSGYNDSISDLFSTSVVLNFSIFGSDIEKVPYINSSSNGNFVTGILWDTSDSSDLEYDYSEAEDVVFVSKVNIGKVGSYGVYDYEISVPSKLREYDVFDEEKVYLYYDLK